MHVEAPLKTGIGSDGCQQALTRQPTPVGRRDADERLRRRSRDSRRHVRDTVVLDAVDREYRLDVTGRLGRLHTATLIHRNVDDQRARLHQP